MPSSTKPHSDSSFYTVAIGASAGGLEPLREILAAIPSNSNMAFIVVMHLDPNHKSLLPDIISKSTALKVSKISRSTKLKPNTVYVLPSDKSVDIQGGKLKLVSQKDTERHHLIDAAFEVLAHDQLDRAVGVILSGAGSDGAKGLAAIKERGGITFAQSEKTAEYPSMPEAASETGVDFVYSPQQIAKELIRLSIKAEDTEALSGFESNQEVIPEIFKILKRQTGIDFSSYKKSTVMRRLQKRMLLNKHSDLSSYLKLLQKDTAEVERLKEDLLINVTHFFRDRQQLYTLQRRVFPELFKKRTSKNVSIWVPGCASGEEAYTLAMMVSEYLQASKLELKVKIYGTDVNSSVVQKAQKAQYDASVAQHVPPQYLKKYFTKSGANYRINKEIRELCEFSRHDLAKKPPYKDIDLISCRNVFIYFNPDLQSTVLGNFRTALRPNGYIMLGKAEDIARSHKYLQPVEPKKKIFANRTNTTVLDRAPKTDSPFGRASNKSSDRLAGAQELLEDSERQKKVEKLREALATTQEYTDNLIGELDIVIEELQATNEELVTGNEELQTTNEELETAQEELRATNDELSLLHAQAAEARDFTEAMIETVRHPLLVLDRNFKIIKANKAFIQKFNLKSSSVKGELLTKLPGSKWSPGALTKLLKSILADEKIVEDFEWEQSIEKIGMRQMLLNARLLEQGPNSDPSILIAIEDVTERKLAEEVSASQRAEAKLNTLLMQAPAAIAVIGGPKRTYQMVNELYCQVFNRSSRQLIGKTVDQAFPELEDKTVIKILNDVFDTGQPFYAEEYPASFRRGKGKSLETGYFKFVIQPIKTSDGSVSDVMVHAVEVTEQVEYRDKLAKSEDQFRVFANHIQNLAWMAEPDGWIYWYNQQWYDYTGTDLEKMKGWGWQEVHHPDHIDRVTSFVKKAWKKGDTWELTFPLKGADGVYRWFLTRAYAVKNDNGEVVRWIGTNTNIDERVKAEEELEEQQSRYKSIFNSTSDALMIFDYDGNLVEVNPAGHEMHGYKYGEMVGMHGTKIVHSSDHPKFIDFINTVKAGKRFTVQGKHLKKSGDTIDIEVVGSGFQYKGKPHLLAMVRDLTDRKKAEEAIKKSESSFKLYAEAMPQMAFIADAEGNITYYNRRWYEYIEGVEGTEGWGWSKQPVHHPDDLDRTIARWTHSLKTGEPYEIEYRLRRHDGVYRWHLGRALPIRNSEGKIEQWLGTNTDIEEIKQQQVMEQRVELLAEQRNALLRINKTKDEFIGLASHQLRTPATAVKQYVGLVIDEFAGELNPRQREYLQIAHESNERQLAIINDLLKTAQLDSAKYQLNKKTCDIVKVVQQAIDDTKSLFDFRNQKITFSTGKKSMMVPIDHTEMMLALVNLLENASKYSHHDKEIKVDVRLNKKIVEVVIEDKGVGIDKNDQKRIFDKLTRVNNELSDTVTGTGLGLYWVKQIVEMHKGSIKLESELGKGSTFTVRLPNE